MTLLMVSLFDHTTIMARPWADAGYLCYCVDQQHPRGETRDGNIIRVGADVHHWVPPCREIRFVAAFPPCTHLAVSGARWFKDKGLFALADAIALFGRAVSICEATSAPYMVENPVSTISTYWRKPDHSFDPCDFAGYPGGANDLYTKRTCLWVGGGFTMPESRRREPTLGSLMHRLPETDDRANLRAATPPGFAQAVFEANQ